MASILNVDQINNAAGTSAVTIDPSTGKPSFPNGATLPAGSVLQVVQGEQTGTQTSTSTSYVDITGLTASITPISTSSKVLVQWSVNGYVPANNGILIVPARGSTQFYYNSSNAYEFWADASQLHWRIANQYLDSPATTSSTTYKMQMKTTGGSSTQVGSYSYPMTITLMEIAQ
jgi:hypothetical protein